MENRKSFSRNKQAFYAFPKPTRILNKKQSEIQAQK